MKPIKIKSVKALMNRPEADKHLKRIYDLFLEMEELKFYIPYDKIMFASYSSLAANLWKVNLVIYPEIKLKNFKKELYKKFGKKENL